ncbi:UPF0758 domain-containing protein [Pedobacter paludis]|uniref:UPF0758 domain-containing protein n=1 Tax=Pedobacter paludis TaxID=2203212 RepID=A0A317ETI1_9SPHI|nr:UPF0758 domain-containing protein [Pedobacter paludis]PWS30260.1 hypothetical protein DF947_17650 [Pedobacter paludis]
MKRNPILASESFMSSAKRFYFFDLKLAANMRYYLQITRSDLREDGSYQRHVMIVFESDFPEFISGFTSLFSMMSYYARGYQNSKAILQEHRQSRGIKSLPEEARPRERMYDQGAAALSDCELLAILLGAGSPGETALELAARIITGHGGEIDGLKGCSFASLCRYKGMGLAKGCAVMAALELAKRISAGAASR